PEHLGGTDASLPLQVHHLQRLADRHGKWWNDNGRRTDWKRRATACLEDVMKMQRREVLGVLTAAAGSALAPEAFAGAAPTPAANDLPKERVTGIGGIFFRAHDPKALGQWYQDHLGIVVIPQSKDDPVWTQEAGPTAFSPFPEKSNY